MSPLTCDGVVVRAIGGRRSRAGGCLSRQWQLERELIAMIVLNGRRKWTRESYSIVVDYCLTVAKEFQVVFQDDLEFTATAWRLNGPPVDVADVTWHRSRKWPGTRIFDGRATLCRIRCSDVLGEWLKRGPMPHEWLAPEWPEDPAFLRSDGSTVLGGVSHEGDLWLELTSEEATRLTEFPGLEHRLLRGRVDPGHRPGTRGGCPDGTIA